MYLKKKYRSTVTGGAKNKSINDVISSMMSPSNVVAVAKEEQNRYIK